LHRDAALSHAKACARGGISRSARRSHSDAAAKALKAIRKVIATRHIGDDTRANLSTQASALEARIAKLLGAPAAENDPLEAFKPQVRTAYQTIIGLIYECASNNAAASALVEKILSRLRAAPQAKSKNTKKRKAER